MGLLRITEFRRFWPGLWPDLDAIVRSLARSYRFRRYPFVSWATLSEDEQKAVYADYQAINGTPGVTPGLGLDSPETATTVLVQDGKTLTTDGSFVEVKEAIGGYLLFEAEALDAAIELAARIPAARLGGAVEVRPIVEW